MKRIIAIAVLAVSAASTFGAELVTNGGFETDTALSPTLPAGWSGFAGDFSGVNRNFGTPIAAHSGLNFYGMGAVNLANQTDLTQSIATTIGATYTVSYWAVDDDSTSIASLLVKFGGTQVGPSPSFPTGAWTNFTANIVATTSLTTLEFIGSDAPGNVMEVDDFSVQVQGTPEPATWAIFGIGALAFIRRRRSRKA